MATSPDSVKLDAASQRELETFINQEQSKARMQSAIHSFTATCWDKCIAGAPSTSFSRYESACMSNCVERFLDSSLFMVRKIEEQRQQAGMH